MTTAEDLHAILDGPTARRTITVGHGLLYVHRDGQGHTFLDRGCYQQQPFPRMPRPERDVLRALLTYALDELDGQDDVDRRIAAANREVEHG